ncbi:MAG: DUF58 domain-containing protein [Anaerolineales bacterium]|nr:DUF58 domain-containing protein [Anaerolineales bacterium]
MNEPLFDEATLHKLEQLSLVARRVRAGVIKGERRSSKRGTAIEFADYRDYVRGDDLRRVDWNVYARLERPFIKLLEEEEDLAVHLLLDNSSSMDWGEGDHNKHRYGLRLAGALAHIALSTGDWLTVQMIAEKELGDGTRFGPSRGQGRIFRLLDWLSGQVVGGSTDLDAALRSFCNSGGVRPGLAIVISDLWSPDGFMDGLAALQARGHEVGLIHLLAPDELDPSLGGDLRLLDVETGQTQDVTVDRPMRDLYRRRVDEWQVEVAAWCQKRQIHYIPVSTELEWEKLVLQTLRTRGMIR